MMSFYIGTYQECNEYDNLVTIGESYNKERGINWGIIHEHPNQIDFSIIKHPKYDAQMTEVDSLSDDWFPEPI